jgi:hypothetical protein
MANLTMEDLAKRLTDLEHQVALLSGRLTASNDWRRTVGMFEGDEFSHAVDAEALAIREADRRAAREGATE